MIRAGGMHVDAGLLSDFQKLIELRQAFGRQPVGLHQKRAVAEKDADAIHAEFLHAGEICARRLRVKLLPYLWRPAGVRAEVIHAEGNKRFTTPGLKPASILGNADFRKWVRLWRCNHQCRQGSR